MYTMDAILTRQSCRSFTDTQITEEQLEKLLVAANAAPVGMGMFDCMALTVIQDKAVLAEIDDAVREQMPNAAHATYGAPTCILVSAKKENGRFDAMHTMSAACIVENMLLAAADLGLSSVYLMGACSCMAGNPELCSAAKVPDGFRPVAMAAVGYTTQTVSERTATTEKLALSRI